MSSPASSCPNKLRALYCLGAVLAVWTGESGARVLGLARKIGAVAGIDAGRDQLEAPDRMAHGGKGESGGFLPFFAMQVQAVGLSALDCQRQSVETSRFLAIRRKLGRLCLAVAGGRADPARAGEALPPLGAWLSFPPAVAFVRPDFFKNFVGSIPPRLLWTAGQRGEFDPKSGEIIPAPAGSGVRATRNAVVRGRLARRPIGSGCEMRVGVQFGWPAQGVREAAKLCAAFGHVN